MTIVAHDNKLNIFLTLTCNLSWNEIPLKLQNLQDYLDLLTRTFKKN